MANLQKFYHPFSLHHLYTLQYMRRAQKRFTKGRLCTKSALFVFPHLLRSLASYLFWAGIFPEAAIFRHGKLVFGEEMVAEAAGKLTNPGKIYKKLSTLEKV